MFNNSNNSNKKNLDKKLPKLPPELAENDEVIIEDDSIKGQGAPKSFRVKGSELLHNFQHWSANRHPWLLKGITLALFVTLTPMFMWLIPGEPIYRACTALIHMHIGELCLGLLVLSPIILTILHELMHTKGVVGTKKANTSWAAAEVASVLLSLVTITALASMGTLNIPVFAAFGEAFLYQCSELATYGTVGPFLSIALIVIETAIIAAIFTHSTYVIWNQVYHNHKDVILNAKNNTHIGSLEPNIPNTPNTPNTHHTPS